MRVQPVNYFYKSEISNSNTKVNSYKTVPMDSVNFGSTAACYKNILKEAVNTTFKKDTEVEKIFNKLFEVLDKDKNFVKLKNYDFISNMHKKEGLRGLLRELWTKNPKLAVRTFVDEIKDNIVPLAKYNGKPVLEVFNWGPQGFLDFMRGNKNAKRDVELFFSLPTENISLALKLNKHGGFALTQKTGSASIFTEFYTSTGNRAKELACTNLRTPDITYFNKDGSKAFFKNWFFGGTPTEPIW